MSKRIAILIRHGDYHQLPDTPSAHQPFPLNEAGFKQAESAINLLQDMSEKYGWVFYPHIDSSKLQRSWQTANIIANGLNEIEAIETYDQLAERCLGSAANLNVKQIEDVIRHDTRFDELPENWKSDSYYCLPLQGAESLMDAGKRVADHLVKSMSLIEPDKNDQDIAKIFIGHGAAFRHAAYHLGVLEFDQLIKLSMFHARPVALEMQQNNRWNHCAGEWKVRKRNDGTLD